MKNYIIAVIIFVAIAYFSWTHGLSGLVQETKNDLTGPINHIEELFEKVK